MANANATTSYRDIFDVKQSTEEVLIPEYFPDVDEVNDRTTGHVPFTTEQVGNISEDAFNTGSILYNEIFPQRAQIPESIYSHAAIFQLSDVFSRAASCSFLMVMDELSIIRNAYADTDNYDKARGIHRFFIDKDTTIFVENIPFVLDYDIEIDIAERKESDGKITYVFTAHYIVDMVNSISDVRNTYVKIVRSGDGYFAMQVECHQVTRDVREESIISSNLINYPTIKIPFDGKLAGFDILYRPPSDDDDAEWTQLETCIINSQARKNPFCYYQLIDDDKLQITFSSQDNFWSPEFDSDLLITLYMTEGGVEGANFDVYRGNNIEIVPATDRWDYANTYLTSAKPLSSSKDGADQLNLDGLQALAVEGYRTALALTTENDLEEYFSNYKYRYATDNFLFPIRKRDDVYERVYSVFAVMKRDAYIYHTNTLRLAMNISDFENVEEDIWMLDPGYLFTANDDSGYAKFYRDPEETAKYYRDYLDAVIRGDVPYIDDPSIDPRDIPDYLKNRHASFAEYKRRIGVDDKRTVFDLAPEEMQLLDDPHNKKFLLINPFLIRFTKNPNLVTTYLTCLRNDSLLEFYKQNNGGITLDDGSFVQFICNDVVVERKFEAEKVYHISVEVSPNVSVDDDYPIIQGVYNEDDELIGYKVGDPAYVIDNDLRVFMEVLSHDGLPVCVTELYPTDYVFDTTTITFSADMYTDDHITSDHKLRILPKRVYRNMHDGSYFKVHDNDPTMYGLYSHDDEIIRDDILSNYVMVAYHAGEIYYRTSTGHYYVPEIVTVTTQEETVVGVDEETGENITEVTEKEEAVLRYNLFYETGEPFYMYTMIDGSGHYFKKNIDNESLISEYDETGKRIRWDVQWEEIEELIITGKCIAVQQYDSDEYVKTQSGFLPYFLKIIENTINLTSRDDILIPVDLVVVKIYTVYRRVYDEEEGGLRLATEDETNNALLPYDDYFMKDLMCYIWTNEYLTQNNPVTFIKVLDSVRTYLTFENFLEVNSRGEFIHDVMDVQLYSIPMLRWSEGLDEDLFSYLMTSFYSQYVFITDIVKNRIRNLTNIDIKFFRTYGCSTNYTIGENGEQLDVVNLGIEFDIWFVAGTDTLVAVPEVKQFIKTEIEKMDYSGFNNLYVSNLMRKIEINFDYVDHIIFIRINNYDTMYQAIRGKVESLDDLSKEERRWYVPEMLVVDLDDIILNEYLTT